MLREKERKIEEERGRLEALKKKLVKRRNSVAVAVSIGSSGIQGGIQSGIGGNGEGRVSLIGSIGGSADSALYSTQTSFDQTLSGHGQQSHQHVETASSMMPIQSSSGMFAVPTVPASNLIKAPEREMEEVMRQEQYVKLKLAGLKGKEGEVAKEKEVLRAETQLHYKELRRFSEEEASIFSGYQVLNDRYLMLRLLGRGGFSEVFRAYDLKLYRFVACKIHQLGVNWPVEKKASYLRHAERECEIHTSLVHDRIVSLYDVFEIDENTFCTVMEYCDGGDLDSYLKQNKALPELEVKILASQLFDGLKYLASRENEKMKIIHYDLKPGNLLFDSEGNLKIADFGLSKIVLDSESDSIDLTSQGAGTYWYLPPECFDPEKPKISSKVDVWSAGVIIYQMLFGSKPFGNNISQKIILERNLINHNLKLEFPASSPISGKKVSDDAKSFLSLCLTPNVLQRPDAIQLSSHPFISFNYGSSSSSSSSSGGGGGGGGASSFPSSSSSGVVGSSIFSSSSIMQHHAASHANPTSSSFLPQRNSPHLHQVPTSPGVSAVRVASLASGTSASVATQATIGGGTFTLVKK
jgi:serine/threonine protein kinase